MKMKCVGMGVLAAIVVAGNGNRAGDGVVEVLPNGVMGNFKTANLADLDLERNTRKGFEGNGHGNLADQTIKGVEKIGFQGS